MNSGWAVYVIAGDLTRSIYYVRIAERVAAANLIKAKYSDALVEARVPIQATVLDFLNVSQGEFRAFNVAEFTTPPPLPDR